MSSDAQLERLTPEDLGLDAGSHVPFRFTPGHAWCPLVISCPHVGLTWPDELGPRPPADFARNADYEVQTLYRGVESLGVATVWARYSRLVVDLNRAADDVPPQLVPDHPAPAPRDRPGDPSAGAPRAWDRPGRGVVWASAIARGTGSVRILEPPLSFRAFSSRIEHYHAPYYRALSTLLERRRKRFGYAVLLDAHSMPGSVGVDLVLGTLDGQSCGRAVADTACRALRLRADPSRPLLCVRRDDPYRGGEIIRTFGQPAAGVHALQLEVSRHLYMDEQEYQLYPWPAGVAATPGAPPDDELRSSGAPRRQELAEVICRIRAVVSALARPLVNPHEARSSSPSRTL